MASVVTAAYMIRRARKLADMENTQFWTDDDILESLNAGVREWWDAITKADPDYGYAEVNVTTTANDYDYVISSNTIAPDFLRGRGVDRVESDGRLTRLEALVDQERIGQVANVSVSMPRYVFRNMGIGTTILHFDPSPGAFTYRVHYTTTPPVLEADTDDFDGINGWEDWPIYKTAAEMLVTEKQDARPLLSLLADMRTRVEDLASQRDAENPPRIAITRPSFRRRTRMRSRNVW